MEPDFDIIRGTKLLGETTECLIRTTLLLEDLNKCWAQDIAPTYHMQAQAMRICISVLWIALREAKRMAELLDDVAETPSDRFPGRREGE